MTIITSLQNPHIGEIVRRRRQRPAGDMTVLIDGRRETERALAAQWTIRELFHCPHMLDFHDNAWLTVNRDKVGNLIEVNEPVMRKIAFGDRTDGMLAVAVRPSIPIARLKVTGRALIAVVHGIEKPGNLGAILRSADAAGVEVILAIAAQTDVYSSAVVRASTGAVFSVPIVECTSSEALEWLDIMGIHIVAARPDARLEYTQVDYRPSTAFVFGPEAEGLGELWKSNATQDVKIPMRGVCDSLNVSVTAAILFFEARRQRS